eukprot:CAMPEP_0184689044 /NCGR_PEP_ID=MMETSP0312-20130426/30429_1 /TAXON_ID=31354 /ORGANISM="Compsopogon coeruleus, Strain SAG 36.94" /LENGTH=167 /DNA_ID=CAMNT_0027146339 /DNA_START=335 /DNA_END=838 /DNA_ORIENTATION=-
MDGRRGIESHPCDNVNEHVVGANFLRPDEASIPSPLVGPSPTEGQREATWRPPHELPRTSPALYAALSPNVKYSAGSQRSTLPQGLYLLPKSAVIIPAAIPEQIFQHLLQARMSHGEPTSSMSSSRLGIPLDLSSTLSASSTSSSSLAARSKSSSRAPASATSFPPT